MTEHARALYRHRGGGTTAAGSAASQVGGCFEGQPGTHEPATVGLRREGAFQDARSAPYLGVTARKGRLGCALTVRFWGGGGRC